jgi:High potential iron-sulfur protein
MFTGRRSKAVYALRDVAGVGTGRRQLVQSAIAMLVAMRTVSIADAASCASPQGSDASLRDSLHYVESSPNPAQRCSGCSFFSDPKGDCGSCAILSAPANINGHCDSWSARS